MDFISIGTYLIANGAAVISGILYWWTIENFQPVGQPRKRPEKLPLVITLALLLTPVGALLISMVIRSSHLIKDIRRVEK